MLAGMRLYLIRHAHAVNEEQDPRRPLCEKGRAVALQVAGFLAPVLEDVGGILHSPLARSRESAAILARVLGRPRLLREVKGLEPEDDPEDVLSILNGRT
jgi:phosphohistidine phosphatase